MPISDAGVGLCWGPGCLQALSVVPLLCSSSLLLVGFELHCTVPLVRTRAEPKPFKIAKPQKMDGKKINPKPGLFYFSLR